MKIQLGLLHLVQHSTSELVGGSVTAHVSCASGARDSLASLQRSSDMILTHQQ